MPERKHIQVGFHIERNVNGDFSNWAGSIKDGKKAKHISVFSGISEKHILQELLMIYFVGV